jgi:hypothetical protein
MFELVSDIKRRVVSWIGKQNVKHTCGLLEDPLFTTRDVFEDWVDGFGGPCLFVVVDRCC